MSFGSILTLAFLKHSFDYLKEKRLFNAFSRINGNREELANNMFIPMIDEV